MRPCIVIFAALLSSPAWADTKFYAFDGAAHMQIGEGGLKVVENSMEFWTEGYPNRRYQILGLVRDKRECTYPLDRSVRYGKVAKAVSKTGATAVILLPSIARAIDLNSTIPEKLTAEQALARAGIRTTAGGMASLAPEALTYRKPEVAIGDEACGEMRFVAVRYLSPETNENG